MATPDMYDTLWLVMDRCVDRIKDMQRKIPDLSAEDVFSDAMIATLVSFCALRNIQLAMAYDVQTGNFGIYARRP